MPTYSYLCQCGKRFDRVLRVADYDQPQACECGEIAVKQLARPMLVIPGEIRFKSPVDGTEITTKQAWLDDMARHNCMEYDPGMKQDYLRRQEESNQRLSDAVDENFDAALEALPTRKKEILEQELRSGADLSVERA